MGRSRRSDSNTQPPPQSYTSSVQNGMKSRTLVTVSTTRNNHVVYPPAASQKVPPNSNRTVVKNPGGPSKGTANGGTRERKHNGTTRHVSRHSLQEAYNHDENEENARLAHLVHIGSSSSSSSTAQSPKKPELHSRTINNGYTESKELTASRKAPGGSRSQTQSKVRTGERDPSDESRACDKYGFFIDESLTHNGTANGDASPGGREGTEERDRKGKKTTKPMKSTKNNLELVKKRERKWAKMLRDNQVWDNWIRRRWTRVRDRCRKGIPDSVRGKAWFYLCGGHLLKSRNPRLFNQLDREKGDDSTVEEIRRDLHRQFPSHEMFAEKDGAGQRDLFRILKAFAVLRPEVGYCQAQAPIAAVLLMQMPAEDAFWSLIAICDHFLPNYFSPGLEAVQIHGDMLNALLKRYASFAYKTLKRHSIEPILYMCEWFMCIFSRSLPWGAVLRIWDMFLCEGVIVVFKTAIAIVSVTICSQNASKCTSLYDVVELLKHLPSNVTPEEFLVDKLLKVELNDKRLIEEHKRQEKKRKKAKVANEKKANKSNNNNNNNQQ